MKILNNKHKTVFFLSIILFALLLNFQIFNFSNLGNNNNNYKNNQKENDVLKEVQNDELLNIQELSSDNEYSGKGAPFNVTQWANRTFYDLESGFTEGSYDLVELDLESDWEGYFLDSYIKNLYDTRNWNNGTFTFGNSDGNISPNRDDSATHPRINNNEFQNWSFHKSDVGRFTNWMSGNYLDSNDAGSGTRDCLELRINASVQRFPWFPSPYNTYYWSSYDTGDMCWWNTSFNIERGGLVDCTLKFDANPKYLRDSNNWVLKFLLNGIKIYSIGTYDLKTKIGGQDRWGTITVPQAEWQNGTVNAFKDQYLEDSAVNLEIRLESLGGNMSGFAYETYQIVYIDNVEIIPKAEVKPDQIGLKLNSTDIITIEWGEGRKNFDASNNKWQSINSKAYVNYSCTDRWDLGNFNISLKLDNNFFITKNAFETLYQTSPPILGTKFSVENNSNVNWMWYVYIQVPTGYFQKNMTIQFPKDLNITSVYASGEYTTNVKGKCDTSKKGLLIINISDISASPDGYWLFEGVSPNYCKDLNIYIRESGNWIKNRDITAGDTINIRANISTSNSYVDIANYIANTKAILQIRFPDGSVWNSKTEIKTPNSNGFVNFSELFVPNTGAEYIAGEYVAIVTWNNSFLSYGINETGVITKKFVIKHDSILKPDNDIYFVENVLNTSIINVKVNFTDKIDSTGINNALVYAKDDLNHILNFDHAGSNSSIYIYVFDASKFSTGNVTLRIFANSSFYLNKQINITIDVIEETILIVKNDFITDVQYFQNFTVQFNYTRKNSPLNEINITNYQNEFDTIWTGKYVVRQNSDNTYNFTCNTTGYAPNIVHTFEFTVNVYKYEAQTMEIKVLIGELDSKIELYVNGTRFKSNDVYSAEVWQKINVTTIYKDTNDNIISDANVKVSGTEGFEDNLTFVSQYNHHTLLLNVSDLAEGIDYLDVYAESINYKPSSIPFIVEITENKTKLEIYFNSINKTKDPSVEVSIGSIVNITVKFFTSTGGNILDAFLELTRDYSANLTENKALNQYQIIMDTKILGVGVHILRLTAEKNNFETQDEYLRIEVKKIRAQILVDEDTIEIKPGEDADLSVELINLENGARISGMIVKYDWKLKDGDFDEESQGIYEVKLKEVPDGSYTIIISVTDPTGQYDFVEIEVTVNAASGEKGTLLWQILLAIAIVAASALAGYIIYYQRVLKYPKPVRKVRKFRRTLKKKESPKVDIISREKAFSQLYSSEKSSVSKIKPIEKSTSPISDKIKKEPIKSEKVTTKSSEKTSNKTLVNKPNEKQINKTNNLSNNNSKNIDNSRKFKMQYENYSNEKQIKLKKLMRKTMRFKNLKWNNGFKRIFLLSIILFSLLFSFIIFNSNNYRPNENNDKNNDYNNININSVDQGLDTNNIFSGIGSSWNVTYYANTTETKIASNLENNQILPFEVTSATGWTGYNLNASIRELYDERQWFNGTFNYGFDDGIYSNNEDDDDKTSVNGWTFDRHNEGSTNNMSGNYIYNATLISIDTKGHDCLELRMTGVPSTSPSGRYTYHPNDYCRWQRTISNIPRGNVIDGIFKIQINPLHLSVLNNWAIKIEINDQHIYTIDSYTLRDNGMNSWQNYSAHQEIWVNALNSVFTNPLYNRNTKIEIIWDHTTGASGDVSYGWEDGPDIDYQQVLIDNVELYLKAQVLPQDVNLKMNNSIVYNNGYGKGVAAITGGNWNLPIGKALEVEFSSQGTGTYGKYELDFTTNLILYARKNTPETYYEPDTNSPGTYFSVENKSKVQWEAYGFVNSPTGYEVTRMRIEFPTDHTVYWVSSLKLGSNVTASCTFLSGAILIPTSKITRPSSPDGFWKIRATSPNYCQILTIYKNSTSIPSGNNWNVATSFYSGDYINITGTISSSLISNHITLTKAYLFIRFPNGSIWTDESRSANVDTNGNFKFNYIRISPNPPNYQAGEYDAIITWNNSFSLRGINETGIIYKKFTVIHDSVLQPEDGKYYIENIIDDGIVNIEVLFKDKEDNTLINNALVYAKNSTNHINYFSPKGSGAYRYEFDAKKALAGNNTLRIFANSSFYKNKAINITLDVTKQTILTVSTNYISTPSNQNFSALISYTELNSPNRGINTTDISTNWDNYTIKRISEGYYNLTCNPVTYTSNTIHTLIFNIRKSKYELQSTAIRIFVSELASTIKLYVNKTVFSPNSFYFTELFQQINITIKYQDISGSHLSGANVTLIEHGKLTEQPGLGQYYIVINTTELGEGIDTLTIFANKSQYDSRTINLNVDISQRKTTYQIYINDVNKTIDPTIVVPITSLVNIKVKYIDLTGNHVENASVTLSAQDININLDENKALKEFITTINTVQLYFGTKTLALDATKTNYEPITKNVKITVRKIATEVTTTSGDSRFEIDPGEDFNMKIELNDLDFGGKVKDAEVSYSWDLQDGDLEETDDGIYEATLENVPDGTYEITITVFKEGGLYEFEDYKITLIVKREEQQALLFLILFVVAVAVISGLAGYFVAYYYVLKYPKPVRKVRKYRRTLKRAKTPKSEITDREKAFNSIYKDYVTKSTHLRKEKIVQENLEPRKIFKMPLKKKLIKKSIK